MPLADALREIIALGGRVGSTELREWASRELHGYVVKESPGYRRAAAVIRIDVLSPGGQLTGQHTRLARRDASGDLRRDRPDGP